MFKGNDHPAVPRGFNDLDSVNAVLASSIAPEKNLNRSSSNRSRNRGKITGEEIVAVSSSVSSLHTSAENNPSSLPDHGNELEDFFYAEGDDELHGNHGPINFIYNMFTCWSRGRPKARSFHHFSGRPRINSFAAAALLEQNRLQQEALVESQDTRDMWEWQMEQQRFITCQEHDLLEKNCLEISLLRCGFSEEDRAGSKNARDTNPTSDMESKESLLEFSSIDSHSKTIFSFTNDAQTQVGRAWHAHADINSPVVLLFEAALLRCRSEINFFCRIYMQQMVFSGYTLIRTLMEMEPNTVFLKKVHASFALESRINNAFFRCFENDSFDDSGLTQIFDPTARAVARLQDYMRMKLVDPEDALSLDNVSYNPCFHSFCANKSEEIMAMFAWDMGYHSTEERDMFMEAFLKASKWVWLLHRLANATNPPMQIIRVGRGQEVDPMYLEPVVVPPGGTCQSCSVASIPKVEFMIMPGFIAPNKIFRCRVYQHYMCK